MDAIEKAIRNAFERGNPEDRAYRVKVYRSAFAALERAIASSGDPNSETSEARRKALKLRIVEIEAEFLPAEEPGPRQHSAHVPAPAVEPDTRGTAGQAVREPIIDDAEPHGVDPAFEPRIDPGDHPDTDDASDLAAPTREEIAPPSPRGRPARRRRSVLVPSVLFILVIAALAGSVWWAGNAGLSLISGEGGSGDAGAPKTISEENTQPLQGGASSTLGSSSNQSWITIFAPTDPTTVSAPPTGKAEVKEGDGGKFLRIQSGSVGSEFGFDVGQGVLEQIAGKHAVFDIIAHAEEGKETQISVNCDLGVLGDCGRKRYRVGHERNDFLFEVDLPDKKPAGAGKITIDPDLDGNGNPLDIVEIRVSVKR